MTDSPALSPSLPLSLSLTLALSLSLSLPLFLSLSLSLSLSLPLALSLSPTLPVPVSVISPSLSLSLNQSVSLSLSLPPSLAHTTTTVRIMDQETFLCSENSSGMLQLAPGFGEYHGWKDGKVLNAQRRQPALLTPSSNQSCRGRVRSLGSSLICSCSVAHGGIVLLRLSPPATSPKSCGMLLDQEQVPEPARSFHSTSHIQIRTQSSQQMNVVHSCPQDPS